jgi:HPt (histidine-containing phosphotransfer) domain-containing protein
MEQHYKLDRVRELAGGDDDFVKALAEAFLEEVPEDASRLKAAVAEKDYFTTYQAAHKMKPTIDLFELGVLQELIEVQDWGKFEKNGEDVSTQLQKVVTAVEQATAEIKSDFNL